MAGYIFSILDQSADVVLTSASTAIDTVHVSANVLDASKPLRTYRSLANPVSSNIDLIFDLVAVGNIDGLFINNVNVNNVEIKGSVDNSTYVSVGADAVPIINDLYVERYKVYVPLPAFIYRYLRIRIPTGTTPIKAPLTSVDIGGVWFIKQNDATVFSYGKVNNFKLSINVPSVETRFKGGTSETSIIGPKQAILTFPKLTLVRDTQETELFNILNTNTAPVLFYENGSDTSKAYIMSLQYGRNATQITFPVEKSIIVSFSLQEVL